MEVSKKVVFIKDWILNYINSMPKQATSLVIGISGGIDSSVASTLCAMTGTKTIVLTMPIKQIISQHNLSLKHEKWLKNKFKNVEKTAIDIDDKKIELVIFSLFRRNNIKTIQRVTINHIIELKIKYPVL